jgi:beta-catenin-like protein 1
MLKKLRMDTTSLSESTFIASGENNDSRGAGSGKRTSVTMEEVEDEDAMNRGFAPGGDADYFAEEDDDGRFFGGGLTSEQKEILNIFDNATNNEDDGVCCL